MCSISAKHHNVASHIYHPTLAWINVFHSLIQTSTSEVKTSWGVKFTWDHHNRIMRRTSASCCYSLLHWNHVLDAENITVRTLKANIFNWALFEALWNIGLASAVPAWPAPTPLVCIFTSVFSQCQCAYKASNNNQSRNMLLVFSSYKVFKVICMYTCNYSGMPLNGHP